MRHIIAFSIFLLFTATTINAQKILGTWHGDLNVGNGVTLAIVLNINGLTADSITMDSPEQAAFGINVDKADFSSENFVIEITSLDAKLEGKPNTDCDTLNCTFTQRGHSFPLTLIRGEYKPKPKKQEPKDFT